MGLIILIFYSFILLKVKKSMIEPSIEPMTNRYMLLGVESAKGGARRVQKKSRSTAKAATDRTENGRATDQKDRNKELELGTDMAFESRIPE